MIVLLSIAGAVLLVIVGLVIAAIVIYSRSQRQAEADKMLSTPLNKDQVYGTVKNSTQNSPYSHPLDEKSAVGMSASSRGLSGDVTAGGHGSSQTK